MLLYLVQHGEAKSEREDPERGLTDKGRADVQKTALLTQNWKISTSALFHSNKTRALETARIMADHLISKGFSGVDGLAPLDAPEIWADRIAAMNEDVMLVGHLPHLAKLAGLLLCGDREKMPVDFKMGGIVCLKRFDDGRWTLEWMVVPEMIR